MVMLQIRMDFPINHVQTLEGSHRPSRPGSPAGSLCGVGLSDGFIEMIGKPDGSVPVEALALEIARHAHPDLCVARSLDVLDDLADACPSPSVESICRFLFVDRGFAGNSENYYDPCNSLLDVVIESRRGIPITLSIVLIAIGSRLGLEFHGVGLPGHFLVGVDHRKESFIDPFGGGQELDLAGVRRLHHRLHGADRAFGPEMLEPVGPRAMARRMLGNLDAIYASRRDLRSRLWASTLRASIPGASLEEEADVASAHAAIGSFDSAADRLEMLALRSPARIAGNYRSVAARWRSQLN
jgi:regulator of sirC expression with transglutaminase-like and TPR domain